MGCTPLGSALVSHGSAGWAIGRRGRAGWNERYAKAEHVSTEPNPLVAELAGPLPPGRTLGLAAGEGCHASGWPASSFLRRGGRRRPRRPLARSAATFTTSAATAAAVPRDPARRYTPEQLAGAFPGIKLTHCEPRTRLIEGDDGPIEITDVLASGASLRPRPGEGR